MNVRGKPWASQTMWILVVKPPRLRPSAWFTGSSAPPFYRLPRWPVSLGSSSSQSSRCRGPSGHPHAASAVAGPRWSRKCHHHATGGNGHRPSSKDHIAPAGHATWPQSTGSRRCRSKPGGHLGVGAPSSGTGRRYLRSWTNRGRRSRSVQPYVIYAASA